MRKMLGFSHEKRVKTIQGFEFEMLIVGLLYSRFEVDGNSSFGVSELAQVLKYALVADFADSDFYAAQVQHHFTQQSPLDYAHYL
jgi:hypothetical protein